MEDDSTLLAKISSRQAEAAECLLAVPRIPFNHIFEEVRRESELQDLCALFKKMKTSTNNSNIASKETTTKRANKNSF